MNVLLSMPNDMQTNNYVINALQDLGHNVFYCDHRTDMKQCSELVPFLLEHEKIDVMIVSHLVPQSTYGVDFLKAIKTQFPQVKYVSWFFDCVLATGIPYKNKEFISILKEYDYFFTAVKGQIEEYRKLGVNAFYCREGVCSYTLNFNGVVEKAYDVSFVGQVGHPKVHVHRFPLLKKICQKFDNSIIYGPIYCNDEDILRHHVKRPTYNDIEHSKVVAMSRINIGFSASKETKNKEILTSFPDVDGAFSARAYRIIGSGGFFLTKRSLGIEDLFEDGKEIVLYDDDKDCLEKIEYYLEHEEEREAIAKAGMKKVQENYTFRHSVGSLLSEVLGEDS